MILINTGCHYGGRGYDLRGYVRRGLCPNAVIKIRFIR